MATNQEETDIDRVRRMLDELLGWRNSCGWNEAESNRYEELCRLELALLEKARAAA